MQIEVLPREPEAAKFERDGVVRHYWKQWAIITVDGLPTAFEFSADEPLPAGPAVLSPKSFGVANGRLTLSRAVLIPQQRAAVRAAPPAAAAAGK